jgi:hypothetical protein
MAFTPNANQIPVYAITPKTSVGSITNGTGIGSLGSDTNGVAIFTASSTVGSRISSLIFTSNDTAARDFFVYILNGSTVCPIGQIHVPLTSGDAASVLPINGLDPTVMVGLQRDNNGNPYIELQASCVLKFSAIVAVTSAKTVYATAQSQDYS